MIIPPSPTGPRSPIRRVMRLGGVVAAPVLLLAAVGVGLAGPKLEPSTPAPSLEPLTSPVAEVSPQPAATRDATTSWNAPDSFAGLNTVLPSEAIALRAGGHTGPLVVRGELKLSDPGETCDGGALGALGPWCARTGILADRAWGVSAAGVDPPAPHLHVTLPLGVRAPDTVARMAVATTGPSLPVVVVGRFTGNRCDPVDLAWCEEPFVVDRVIWVDGVRAALTPLTEDRLQGVRRRPNPFELAVAHRQTPLLAVLAWPATIARLDPATVDRLEDLEASTPVWYLRVLESEWQGPSSHGGTLAVHWYLLDERLLSVIATGDTGATADASSVPEARTAGPPVPIVFANLGVRSVADARDAAPGSEARPVAVAGRLRDLQPSGRCAREDAIGTWCARVAVLEPVRNAGTGGVALTVRIPPGVQVPAEGGEDNPVDVVIVVGLLQPAAAGCGAGPACGTTVHADRIAAAGGGRAVEPVIQQGVPDTVRQIADRVRLRAEGLAAGASGAVLRSTLVRKDHLAVVDAAASSAVSSRLPRERPLWYATAVQTVYGTRIYPPSDIKPRITWVVVDAVTGRLLASGVR